MGQIIGVLLMLLFTFGPTITARRIKTIKAKNNKQ